MTESDIATIEQRLAVELPATYRRRLIPYPVPAPRGNTDTELWDDPELLIRRNHSLRAGEYGCDPWPEYLFAVGQVSGDPSIYAIDLRRPEGPVWWVDHGDAAGDVSDEICASLERWLDDVVPQLENGVEELGVAPAAAPSEHARAEARATRVDRRVLFGFIVVLSLLLIALAAVIGT